MRITFFLALFLAISLASCEGPLGPMGPEGPEGPPGTVDVQTASVNFSHSFGSAFDQKTVDLSAGFLSSETLSNSAVYSYVRFSGSDSWWALPYSGSFVDGYWHFLVEYRSGLARLYLQRATGSGSTSRAGTFRVVQIDGSNAVAGREQAPSYAELAAAYSLPLD